MLKLVNRTRREKERERERERERRPVVGSLFAWTFATFACPSYSFSLSSALVLVPPLSPFSLRLPSKTVLQSQTPWLRQWRARIVFVVYRFLRLPSTRRRSRFPNPTPFSPTSELFSSLAAQRTVPRSLSLSLSLSSFLPCRSPLSSSTFLRSPFLWTGSPCASSSTVEATVVLARDRSPAWMAATRCSPFLPRCCCCSQSELRAHPSEDKKKVYRRSGALELFGPGIVST